MDLSICRICKKKLDESQVEKEKNCPFCGGKAHLQYAVGEYWVTCDECKASTTMFTNMKMAVEAWNKRKS